MSAFVAWGSTLLGLAVITTIAEMLLPKGKTRTVIRSVVATVTVLTIITPIPGLIKTGDLFNWDSIGEVQTDDDYLDYIENAKKSVIISAACEYLKSAGYDGGYTLDVELGENYSVRSVCVKFTNSGITQNGVHINKSEFIGLIADYFAVGREAVMTYG